MTVIFVLSAQSNLPTLSTTPRLQETAGHLLAYGLLGLLWQRALGGAGVRRAGLWAALICLVYGISDELHQSMVPGRAMDFYDVVMDAAGGALGAWVGGRLSFRQHPHP